MRQPLMVRTAAAYSSWPTTPWTAATGSSWICRPAWRRNQIYESLSKVRSSLNPKCQLAYHIWLLWSACLVASGFLGRRRQRWECLAPEFACEAVGFRAEQLWWHPYWGCPWLHALFYCPHVVYTFLPVLTEPLELSSFSRSVGYPS